WAWLSTISSWPGITGRTISEAISEAFPRRTDGSIARERSRGRGARARPARPGSGVRAGRHRPPPRLAGARGFGAGPGRQAGRAAQPDQTRQAGPARVLGDVVRAVRGAA